MNRARPVPPPAASRRKKLWFALAGLVALGAVVVLFFVLQAKEHATLTLPIDLPTSKPTGDPIHVAYAVKPGDIFVMECQSANRILTTTRADVDTKEGMQFDARSTIGHEILARDGGMMSKVVLYLDRVDSHIEEVRDDLSKALFNRASAYTVMFERDAKAIPIPGKVHPDFVTQKDPRRRVAVDSVLSGLSDIATNWLPPHDVRIGETWDVASVADVVPRVEVLFRAFAQRQDMTAGYPPIVAKAVLQAVSREPHEGEDCLRLRVAALLEMNGETKLPAFPGFITGAATIDGFLWVSIETGILWGMEAKSALLSNYRNDVLPPQERRSEGTIRGLTHRSKSMP